MSQNQNNAVYWYISVYINQMCYCSNYFFIRTIL